MRTQQIAISALRRAQSFPLSWRVGITITFVVIAAIARLKLFSDFGTHNIYLTFYPVIILGSILGGIFCGLLATILSIILLHVLIAPVTSTADALALLLFVGIGVLLGLVLELIVILQEKNEELEVRRAQRHFKSFFHTTGVGTAIINKAGFFIDVNEKFCENTGYSREELIEKMSPLDLDHPDEKEEDRKRIARFMSGEYPVYDVTKRYVKKDGEIIWVRVCATPIKDENGKIYETAAIIENVSSQKDLEKTLKESVEKFRGFFQNVATGSGLLNSKGDILDVNENFCQMVGYSRDEIIGKMHPRDFDHPDSQGIIKEPIDKLLRKEIPSYKIEKHCLTKDGKELWLRVSSSPILNEDGKVTHIAGVLEDITSIKQDQKKLSESEERLRLSLEAGRMGIWDWDLLRNEITWNDQMYRFLGLAPQSVPADLNYWMDHVHTDDKEKLSKILYDIPEAGLYFEDEYRILPKNGGVLWVNVRGHTRRDKFGRSIRSFAVVSDVTDQKRIQRVAEQSQRLEAVAQLAGGIIHDLNNLLLVISGNIELAQKKITDTTALKLLKSAVDAVETGTYFNKRLLSLSKQDEEGSKNININERLVETVKLLERFVGENINISFTLEPNPWTIFSTFSDVDSVFTNIIINARDSMPNGGNITISSQNISLDCSKNDPSFDISDGDYVKVSISDTGEGMTEEVLRRIPEPFFTTKSAGKGTGLGLYTTNSIIQKAGGFLKIESKLGFGTRVDIYLPRSSSNNTPKVIPKFDDIIMGDGQLILVVEDEPKVREITMQRLESLGYAVEPASSAEEGFQKIQSNDQIALVLSDIILQGKQNGFDLAHRVLTEKPEIKVVLNSGYSEPSSSLKYGEEIARLPLLRKPYSRTELACAISKALSCSEESIRKTSPAKM